MNKNNNAMPRFTLNHDQCFLPNFCGLRMVFIVVVIAQLFSFVVILVAYDQYLGNIWQSLGLISLFVQWCALASCALMCVMRRFIARLRHRWVAVISFISILLVVLLVSEMAYWLAFPGAIGGGDHVLFVLRNLAVGAILVGALLRHFYVKHQWTTNVRAEAESRLQALQSRIRPHFFFNSMNTIASLTRSDPRRAETAVEDLADLFRASMREATQFHTLEEEWHLCRRYLDIETLRLGERLKIEWDIDGLPKDAFVPPLLIQPLIENAIYHGIEPRQDGGLIQISGRLDEKRIVLQISNSLSDRQTKSAGNRIAQQNIRDRLVTLFEDQGSMQVETENELYRVTLSWPYWNKLNEDTDR